MKMQWEEWGQKHLVPPWICHCYFQYIFHLHTSTLKSLRRMVLLLDGQISDLSWITYYFYTFEPIIFMAKYEKFVTWKCIHSLFMRSSKYKNLTKQRRIKDFPERDCQPKREVPTYYFTKICRKLHENEKIWTEKGGRVQNLLCGPATAKFQLILSVLYLKTSHLSA